ncbi:MAG: Gfo/Idh/MocA family oxidoreductase [Yoonia sp.]|uniref:Gfo/Idh/MocA family protein n=2 Tax=Yoonia sp. TaxID=2212373 RepID=UPI00326781BA
MPDILVIGAGLIGARHVAAVQDHPDCTLAGVVDPVQLDGIAAPVFRDIADVNVHVDGAIIATPTGLHASHGLQCAQRGWHMLIEKPVTATLDEARVLGHAVRTHGVRCLVGHHRRYHPSIDVLRDAILSGKIGAPVTSTLIWAMRKHDSYFNADWRRTDGSPVMINLVHDIDLLRFIFGEVTDIAALGSNAQRGSDKVESGGAVLRFESGLCATISFADTAPSPWGFEAGTAENPNIGTTGQDMWWITGTLGGIAFPSLTLWGGASDWSQPATAQTLSANKTVPLIAQLTHFCQVIAGTAEPIIDVDDAARTLKVTRDIETLLAQQILHPEDTKEKIA